ncbi:MAG: M15 family metallopeptidase, partial [Nanoarchaeota archaeon]|nr:M15 family metallopeptidase [Nanoarchaeota archaeon]MBU1632619.1 M15 family metallopeptidase [Nanoarchaeota archaeon]MBU1876558.1 M15 family metallopeptidase [Nanoarchaeota archaeon]
PPISAGPQSGAALSQCVDKQVAKTNIPGCQDSQRCKEIDEVWSQKIGLIVSGNNQIWDTQINSLNTFDKVYYTIQQVCGPAQPTTNNQQIIINNQQSTTQKIVTPTTQSTQPTTMASSYSSITIPNVSDDFCSKIKQEPQERFMRKNYLPTGTLQEFINYRTQNYGHFPGFGDKSLNKNPPLFYAEKSTFMGLAVNLNKKIIPALKCVEQELTTKQRCQVCENTQKYPDECGLEWKKYPYQPKGYSTFRGENSYLSGEVSNHVYGIAIDIDPSFNSKVGNGCCGCGDARYKADPLCKNPNLKTYQRMVMPACWIDVFEEYGFYWLGDDPQIQDAMHFEFLGDPTIIERALS